MDRPYSRYSPTTDPSGTPGAYGSRRSGGYTDVETAVIDDRARYPRGEYGHDYASGVQDYDEYQADHHHADHHHADHHHADHYQADHHQDEYDDEIHTYHDPIDRRWIWVAGVAGAILLVAVICTVVILGGGDSGSVSKTVIPPLPTTALATTTAPSVVAAPPAPVLPSAPLSPETVTTVPPSPTASAAAPAPAEVAPSPSAVTYQVTGTRQMIDLVTVVYTDAQGALQTEFNVALPWTRTVTLDPGVSLSSVTATSLTGQLNCAITDAAGATLVAQANNAMITTCTK